MSIIPYNHLMVYQRNNKFNERKSILKQIKEMLSYFFVINDNYSSNKI